MDDSFDVVISGIGGHFPECDNVDMLMEKLLLGENMITLDDRRWTPGKLGVNASTGKVSEFQYFDNQFYGIHRALTTVTDPITRLLFERVVEAVFDAGYSIRELYGTKTSVYTSCSISENEATFLFNKNRAQAFTIVGTNRSMMANRISYFFNLNGRSCAYDGTWAWAAIGLQMAYTAIKSGECDSVIMGGTSLCLHPEMSVLYGSMNLLSPDGVCRPFDADANGSVRAESQVVLLIQRSDQAKRAYAKVLGAKMFYDGIRERELLSPTSRAIASTVNSVYEDSKIDKRRVKYVECHGSGYQPSDYAEVEGLKNAFCGNRGGPLLIGSVKGNVGNTEGPSGMVSLIKAISILRSGVIPKTLNYNKPNPRIPSLVDGSVQVVNENTPIVVDDDTVVGCTSLSYSGTVGHVALAVASKNKEPVDPEKEIPRLILACGRSEAELKRILTKISEMTFDPEYYRLVQDIFSNPIKSYNFRGHIICPSPPETPLHIDMGGWGGRPVWFVFSGMGSQWPGMGRDLLKVPAFAATIDRCHAVLETKGLNLRKIITHPEPDIFDNILHSFVGIAAVQVGLINIMRLLGINPEGFIGHSVGEQACAYMDGCIDEEQTMLAAYARGMASNEANLIRGMMAAIGIGYKNIKDRLPASIEVACHNSSDNCTISGPADDVNEYVETLKKQNVFARAVNVSNTAYHSRYVKDAGPILLRRLSEVITEPKPRSERWISTSAPEELWVTEDARFCSATYLTNNLLGAVLFEEAMKFVPENVVLIEIAPHGLLQAILRRSAPRGTTNISLTQRNSDNGLDVLYNAISKLYMEGLCPKVANLYPDIEFPVSRQTPSTADLVTYAHNEPFYTTVDSVLNKEDYLNQITLNEETPSDIFRERAVCTPSYYLAAVWESLSSMRRFGNNEMIIEFANVRYFEPLNTPSEGEHTLCLQVQHAMSLFEVCGSDSELVIMGKFKVGQEEEERNETEIRMEVERDANVKKASMCNGSTLEDAVTLSADQIYSELAMRGHTYRTSLKALTSVEISDKFWRAKINHNGNIIAVLAATFQLIQLHHDQSTQVCAYPKYLRKLFLDPKKFLQAYPGEAEIFFDIEMGQVSCAGLIITGLEFRPIQTETAKGLQLQASSLSFIPYGTKALQSFEDVASLAFQLTEDTQPTAVLGLTILQLHKEFGHVPKTIGDVLKRAADHHNLQVNLITLTIEKDTNPTLPPGAKTCGIILTGSSTVSVATTLLERCPSALILAYLHNTEKHSFEKFPHLKLLAGHFSDTDRLILIRPLVPPPSQTEVVMVSQDEPIPKSINVSTGALFVWTTMPSIGIRAVLDKMTKLAGGVEFRMIFILDKNAPAFSTSHRLYRDQLAVGMRINILQNGVWGSLKTLPLPFEAHIIPNGRESLLASVSTNRVNSINITHWGIEQLSATKMSHELALDFCGEGANGPVFGVARAIDGQPQLDPLLQWPVPPGWTATDASTVPLAYCQAYLALRLFAHRSFVAKESILVTDPLRPEGQAAVRIALASERFKTVFTVAKNELEKNTIEALFSDFRDAGKHSCIQTGQFTLGNALFNKKLFGVAINIIVTSKPDDVRTEVLDVLQENGHLVCLGGAETAIRETFGTRGFVKGLSLHFATVQSVIRMRYDDRQSTHAAIAEGLKPNGFVKPLRRIIRSTSSTKHALWNDPDAKNNKVVLQVELSENPTYTFKTGSSCLISGGTPQQQVKLAHWSARHGIKTIVVICVELRSQLFSRHEHLLKSVYGAKMGVYSILRTGLMEAVRCGSLALMLAVAHDPGSERLALELARTRTTIPLVVFGPKGSDHGALAESCMARHARVSHSLLLVGMMDQAVNSRLMDWLLREENPPAIILLRCPADSQAERIPAARLLKLLPQSTESLAALGRSLVTKKKCLRLVELATNGPKQSEAREVFPLIVVPGLAESMDTVLKPLADKLLVPLLCVRLPDKVDNVTDEAKIITNLIQERQPDGPYTLLGFDWTATLTQQIAQELQKNGSEVILLLMDGESSDVSEVALLRQRHDFESLILSTCLNLQVNSTTYAKIYALPTWSERIRHLAPTFEEGSQDMIRALNAIRGWVDALACHKVSQYHANTHLIRTSALADVSFVKTSRLSELHCTETQAVLLTTPKCQQYINDHTGHPCLQTNEALIRRAF